MKGSLRAALSSIDGVVESPSMFKSDLAYWVDGKEIAHFESDDVIEIRLTREVIRELRDELRADPRVDLRRPGSDWIEVRVTSDRDREFVVDLVARAVGEHLPPPSRPLRPPPVGADLERRRRFH